MWTNLPNSTGLYTVKSLEVITVLDAAGPIQNCHKTFYEINTDSPVKKHFKVFVKKLLMRRGDKNVNLYEWAKQCQPKIKRIMNVAAVRYCGRKNLCIEQNFISKLEKSNSSYSGAVLTW